MFKPYDKKKTNNQKQQQQKNHLKYCLIPHTHCAFKKKKTVQLK